MKYISIFIAGLMSCLFTGCDKSKNTPSIEPELPSETIDTSFWASDDVLRYQGSFIRIDSVVVSGTYPEHTLALHAIDTSVRLYRKRIIGDSVYLTFDPLAINTSIAFSIKDSLADGWYIINDYHQYKLSGDSLYFQSKFDYKNQYDQKWHYVETSFQAMEIK